MAAMIAPVTTISRGTTTSNSTDKPASSRMASTVPAIMVSGAVIIMIVTSAVSVWIWWVSLGMRVMSEGVPNRPISRVE